MRKIIALATMSILSAVALASPKTVTLSVPGMDCATCPITVKKALMRVSGVSAVEVSFEKRQAVVTFDDAQANLAALMKASKDAGYPSTPTGATK